MLDINATFLVTFAVVWILVIVLSRVFFRPFQKIRRDRDARLAADREAARAAEERHVQALRDIEQELKAARAAADKIREDLEVEALKEKTRLLNEVGAAVKLEVEEARGGLAREIEGLKAGLEAEAGTLAESIEKRLLQ